MAKGFQGDIVRISPNEVLLIRSLLAGTIRWTENSYNRFILDVLRFTWKSTMHRISGTKKNRYITVLARTAPRLVS
jgi:hypothetical protein